LKFPPFVDYRSGALFIIINSYEPVQTDSRIRQTLHFTPKGDFEDLLDSFEKYTNIGYIKLNAGDDCASMRDIEGHKEYR
jgi:hypothetical protein